MQDAKIFRNEAYLGVRRSDLPCQIEICSISAFQLTIPASHSEVALDRTSFNRAGMKRNAADGLFTKSSSLLLNYLLTIHIGSKHLRDNNTPVFLLVIFQDCH